MPESKPRRSALRFMTDFLRRIFRNKPSTPEDPYADRLVPVRRGPKGRSGAAVAEPEDDSYRWFPPRRT
jgi:hypothetical protein